MANEARRSAFDLSVVALLAALMLLVAAPVVDPSRLHISMLRTGFNDQSGYVTTARSLAETGRLRPHGILTSALWRQPSIEDHHLYQPGHFASIAAAYRLLGYGPWQSFAFNLMGFVVSAMGVFYMARRGAGRAAGYLAALLWIGFPPHLLFAWSAMAELSFIVASTVALWVFLAAPERWRLYVGPLMLLLPFLVRDTGSLLVAPMAAVVVYGERGERLAPGARPAILRGIGLLLGSVALCLALYQTPLCRPRVNTNPGFLLDGSESVLYNDAARQRALSGAPASAYVDALLQIYAQNKYQFLERLRGSDPSLLIETSGREVLAVCAVLLLLLLCIGLSLRRRIILGQGIVVTMLITVGLTAFAYEPFHYRGLRMMLYTLPLALCALAVGVAPLLQRRVGQVFFAALCVGQLCLSQAHLRAAYQERPAADALDDRNTAFLETLGHDDRTVLAAPFRLALDYMVRHYPVDFAFLPANRETLRMLQVKHRVGTVVLPDPPGSCALTPEDLRDAGFTFKGPRRHDRRTYLIFQADRTSPGADQPR